MQFLPCFFLSRDDRLLHAEESLALPNFLLRLIQERDQMSSIVTGERLSSLESLIPQISGSIRVFLAWLNAATVLMTSISLKPFVAASCYSPQVLRSRLLSSTNSPCKW